MHLTPVLRWLAIACWAVMLADPGYAQPDLASPGISRELAAWRAARYRDVSYALDIALQPPFDKLRGRLRLRFRIDAVDSDLILDWRREHDARVSNVRINRSPVDAPRVEREHLIIARTLLQSGVNELELAFEVPLASAGTALTRFHDAQDDSDYVYSLFVPADASSVFPCFDQPDLKARFELSALAPARWRVISNAAQMQREEEAGS